VTPEAGDSLESPCLDRGPARQWQNGRAKNPSDWSLPVAFMPRGRAPLTHNARPERWLAQDGRARLRAASRGQEFVLDLDLYPEVNDWVAALIRGRGDRQGVTA
jgi:hypothetical protein